MGSKHSRLASPKASSDTGSTSVSGSSTNWHADELSAEARAEFTVRDIHCPDNTRHAQELLTTDPDRFCKYRNYFKNHHMSLAREVGGKTSKSKVELLHWVEAAVGPLEDGAKWTKDEILEIAMVSAALTEYTESALSKMYDRGELDALPNVPLHTHSLRMPAKQQACRDSSDAVNKDKLEAAHYIGLEVMLRLNERLPVAQRMGEELREILNHPSNLRLMLATSNQTLHKKVDTMLINAIPLPIMAESTVLDCTQQERKISTREYDRLVQIAKHAQDEWFQDAMIAANGYYLYASLRQQFILLTISGRPKLWDLEKDKPELRESSRPRIRSASPVPQRPRTPPSPSKKKSPERRMQNPLSSSPCSSLHEKHASPFSRLAAKLFRSRRQKMKQAQATQPKTTGESHREPPIQAGPTIQVKKKKKRPVTKTKTTIQGGNTNRSKPDAKRKPRPSTAVKKRTGKQSTLHLSQDVSSEANSSSEDSDYIDEDGSAVNRSKPTAKRKPRSSTAAKKRSGKQSTLHSSQDFSEANSSSEDSDYINEDGGEVNRSKPTAKRKPRSGTAVKKRSGKQSTLHSSQDVSSEANSSLEDSDYTVEDGGEAKSDRRVYHVGPRGGRYFINARGKKVYDKTA
ncbi:hypothetical protein PsorP6_007391 [Peronosclerospora sorghi]|uniref:Uncharacterized protein n=1 Tax=Peronosclerospora sorghi TaxID=230839 RepID=A0ACC0W8P1_9STRA|nr:hypothetical protein PsorP6_007391 [Peronosclerospora sorghi]